MKKTLSIFLFTLLSISAMCQLLDHHTYRLYAIRTNTNGTVDSFYVKNNTDSLFSKSEVYVQRTKEYYDQFWMPEYPNSFERFSKGGDNIWRNVLLPGDDITGTSVGTSGYVLSTSPSAGIGYAAGAGGTITQLTNKTTGVTLNKICGQITTANSALAGAAEAKFTVSNNTVGANDVVFACIRSGGTSGSYMIAVTAVSANSFDITLSNVSAGNLSEAVVINYVVIKAAAN